MQKMDNNQFISDGEGRFIDRIEIIDAEFVEIVDEGLINSENLLE